MVSFFRMLILSVHFALASLLGLLLGLLRPFNPDNSRLCAYFYGAPALRILGLKVRLETQSMATHKRPAVLVGNHISNHDLFVFGHALPPRTVSLGKKSLKWVPLFGQVYWLSGNIMIDRSNPATAKQALVKATQTLHDNDMSLWVFAEGTRGHGKGLGPLKPGAFVMAIQAGVPIIPVCASNYVNHMKLNRWHSGEAIIRSLPPIPTAGMTLDDVPVLMAQCHAQMKACIAELDARVLSRSAQ